MAAICFITWFLLLIRLASSSADERRKWQKDIDIAREEKRQYKRRMSEAIERQRRQSVVCCKTITEED